MSSHDLQSFALFLNESDDPNTVIQMCREVNHIMETREDDPGSLPPTTRWRENMTQKAVMLDSEIRGSAPLTENQITMKDDLRKYATLFLVASPRHNLQSETSSTTPPSPWSEDAEALSQAQDYYQGPTPAKFQIFTDHLSERVKTRAPSDDRREALHYSFLLSMSEPSYGEQNHSRRPQSHDLFRNIVRFIVLHHAVGASASSESQAGAIDSSLNTRKTVARRRCLMRRMLGK